MIFENVTTGFCGYCDFDKNFWQKSSCIQKSCNFVGKKVDKQPPLN